MKQFHFSFRQSCFLLYVFAEVDGSISNLNVFSPPVAADFKSLISRKYVSLGIEVQPGETALKEDDLLKTTFITPPSEAQVSEIGTAILAMLNEMIAAESGTCAEHKFSGIAQPQELLQHALLQKQFDAQKIFVLCAFFFRACVRGIGRDSHARESMCGRSERVRHCLFAVFL